MPYRQVHLGLTGGGKGAIARNKVSVYAVRRFYRYIQRRGIPCGGIPLMQAIDTVVVAPHIPKHRVLPLKHGHRVLVHGAVKPAFLRMRAQIPVVSLQGFQTFYQLPSGSESLRITAHAIGQRHTGQDFPRIFPEPRDNAAGMGISFTKHLKQSRIVLPHMMQPYCLIIFQAIS